MFEIPILTSYNNEYNNERLFDILSDRYVVDWEFNEENQTYQIKNTYEKTFTRKITRIGDHFSYNPAVTRLSKYDYIDYDFSTDFQLMDIIDEKFPIINLFIKHNNVHTVKFKLINEIFHGNYKNKTTELFNIYGMNSNITHCLVILALIKMINSDSTKISFKVKFKDFDYLINTFNEYNLSINSIFKMIQMKLIQYTDLLYGKCEILSNLILRKTAIQNIYELYEFKFITAMDKLTQKYRTSEMIDFLKSEKNIF